VHPRRLLARHEQRHVRRKLRRRRPVGRRPRVSPPLELRVGRLSPPPVPAPAAHPAGRPRRRGPLQLLRRVRRDPRHPLCHLPRHLAPAAGARHPPRRHPGRRLPAHADRHVLQRLHLHLGHPGRHSGQVPLRLDGGALALPGPDQRRQGRAEDVGRSGRADGMLRIGAQDTVNLAARYP
jgi:hypothetical protein